MIREMKVVLVKSEHLIVNKNSVRNYKTNYFLTLYYKFIIIFSRLVLNCNLLNIYTKKM